jgi:hypothetical protein
MELSGQLCISTAYALGERAAGTPSMRGWMDRRAGMGGGDGGKALCPCRGAKSK